MSLLFQSDFDLPAEWLPLLRNHLPTLPVHVWPNLPDPADITYALVWKPPPGLLASLPNLRAAINLGAGVDALLADPTLPPDLTIVRLVDPGLTQGMVEFVVWQVLDLHRDGPAYRQHQADSRWQKIDPRLAGERSVGILGLGTLGTSVAAALSVLGFKVRGWTRTPREVGAIEVFSGLDNLPEMLSGTDILVNLLPLTAATTGIIDAKLLAGLPAGASVVNAGRGSHVVDTDLLAALDSGHVDHAALDVFGEEPLPADHPYWHHPSVTVTPHVASMTLARTAAPVLASEIQRMEMGRAPINQVDRSAGY